MDYDAQWMTQMKSFEKLMGVVNRTMFAVLFSFPHVMLLQRYESDSCGHNGKFVVPETNILGGLEEHYPEDGIWTDRRVRLKPGTVESKNGRRNVSIWSVV